MFLFFELCCVSSELCFVSPAAKYSFEMFMSLMSLWSKKEWTPEKALEPVHMTQGDYDLSVEIAETRCTQPIKIALIQ